MMPVAARAALRWHCRLGSFANASAPLSKRMPSTPLASGAALDRGKSSLYCWLVATISFAALRCARPCSAHRHEHARAGDAQVSAIRLPLGCRCRALNDLGVARAGLGADRFGRLDDDDSRPAAQAPARQRGPPRRAPITTQSAVFRTGTNSCAQCTRTRHDRSRHKHTSIRTSRAQRGVSKDGQRTPCPLPHPSIRRFAPPQVR